MVKIRSFRGLRYNPNKIHDYQDVTAPPYDVISAQEQKELHNKSSYNIVHLILGLKQSSDSEQDNVYTRASTTLNLWLKDEILKYDSEPAVYAYTQTWNNIERRGWIASLQLQSYDSRQILPHEFTLGGPKADRLALTKATGCILSPIFCLYHDAKKRIETMLFQESPSAEKTIEVTDKDDVIHRFWPVTDTNIINSIENILADSSALIADGHHRYETALAYQSWKREKDNMQNEPTGTLPWDFTMAFFTNMADEGLKIYPTHRVLTSLPEGFSKSVFADTLKNYFEPASEDSALFWLQDSDTSIQPYKLKTGADISGLPEPFWNLDVALIDHIVFQGILKQSANDLKQAGHLQFIREDDEVLAMVKQGGLALWVHAPSVEQVKQVCEAGLRMPQKSTYFYPKLLSGLVLYGHSRSFTPCSSELEQGEVYSL